MTLFPWVKCYLFLRVLSRRTLPCTRMPMFHAHFFLVRSIEVFLTRGDIWLSFCLVVRKMERILKTEVHLPSSWLRTSQAVNQASRKPVLYLAASLFRAEKLASEKSVTLSIGPNKFFFFHSLEIAVICKSFIGKSSIWTEIPWSEQNGGAEVA